MPDTLLQHYESIEGQHSSEHESEGRIVLYDGIATTGRRLRRIFTMLMKKRTRRFGYLLALLLRFFLGTWLVLARITIA